MTMSDRYEYMVLNLKKSEQKEWLIEYMDEEYPKATHLIAMLDYLGLDGWKLVSSTHYTNKEGEGETLYFKRDFKRVSQPPKLQSLINEIDSKSNQRFVESALGQSDSEVNKDLIKQKVLKHLYDWLEKHHFEWGEPGSGVRESHYLNKMEDVTDDPLFPEYHGINKVSTRIDIFKESDRLRIALKRRISGKWIDYSQFSFDYTKEGLLSIQTELSMQFYKLLSN